MLTDLTNPSRVWGVFCTKSRKEAVSREFITREGLDAYCPKGKAKRSGRPEQPLFPGYIFVYLSPRLEMNLLRYCPGILRPLIFGNQLAFIEDAIITHWREREAGLGYLKPAPKPVFKIGQKVQFNEGVFAGMEGEILEDLPAKERVKVLLEHLRMSVAVEAERSMVRAK